MHPRVCARPGRPSPAEPVRLNGVVHASTVPTPDHSTTASRVGSRSTSNCTSSQRNSWLGRLRAVHAETVLGQVSAVGGDESALAGIGDQAFGHGGDRVGDVVVPRPACEGQAAGHRQRPAAGRRPAGPIRWRPPAPRTGSTSRRRSGRDRRRRRRPVPVPAARDPDRRRPVELRALADGVGVVRIGAGVRENPTLRRNLKVGRLLDRGEHQAPHPGRPCCSSSSAWCTAS